jgi:TonB family protein
MKTTLTRTAALLLVLASWQPVPASAGGLPRQAPRHTGIIAATRASVAAPARYVALRRARRLPPGANWSASAHARWRAQGMSRLRTQMTRVHSTTIRILGSRRVIAHVRFTVLSDGRLTGVALAGSSGNRAIDRLALGVVRGVGRMPAPGPHRRVNVTVPLAFIGREHRRPSHHG